MRLAAERYALPLAAGMLVAVLAALAITGKSPDLGNIVRFEAKGLVAEPPAALTAIDIAVGQGRFAFHRGAAGGWETGGSSTAVPRELADHLETALRFLHVSEPVRSLEPAELGDASFAAFGLDPPALVVSLGEGDKSVATIEFGAFNPAQTSQYVRVVGTPRVYLMPRHVGAEWQVAIDMARRALPPDAAQADADARAGMNFLLPTTMSQVWAVELVYEGRLRRFERDGAGNWFLHTGQHSHVGNTNQHVADPAQAPVIAAALAGFEQARVEGLAGHRPASDGLKQFGLALPPLIVLLYPRDSSVALARVEFGERAGDGFGRYARLGQSGDVVIVADYEARRLTELLRAVGAGS